MILYGSTRSPFVRKVAIALYELGLFDAVDFRPVVVSSTSGDEMVSALNPLGQIPTLVTNDGAAIHDSLVICAYLNDLTPARALLPQGPTRWDVLSRHAVGNGMTETLVKLFTERRRTGDPLHSLFAEQFSRKVMAALPGVERYCTARPAGRFDLGDIAISGALAYADFRFPALDWRAGHAAIAAFHDEVSARPSVLAVPLSGESPNAAPSAS